jgi:ApaG protein
MTRKTINNIKISVKTNFRDDVSDVNHGSYLYNYRIVIQNLGINEIQLLRRYWKIEHLNHGASIVSGEGVVGEQPKLQQNEVFAYMSGCQMIAPIGRMSGYYTFKDLVTGEVFPVEIPTFQLVYPAIMN